MNKNTIALTILSLLLLTACQQKTTQIIFENNKTIDAEIAQTDAELQKGLMYRQELAENTGMLFILPSEEKTNFWMKNTTIPLDIIFLNSNKTIVHIANAVPCKQDPCTLYSSEKPTKYVIEVNAGYCKKNSIIQGQTVTFK